MVSYFIWTWAKALGIGRAMEEEVNNQIGPTVKHEWNVSMYLLHIFCICRKHNSLPLGPIQPSSPSTKELHGRAYRRLTRRRI